MNKKTLLLSTVLFLSSFALALTIKPNAPNQYTVVKGDTLWDISGQYLSEPWRWGEIWRKNPQIKNPHLIYPGDMISLKNGKLSLTRGNQAGKKHVKLTRNMKEVPISLGVPAVSYEQIKTRIKQIQIVPADSIKTLPYIIATEDNRLIATQNAKVYINRALVPGTVYNVYEKGEAFKAIRGEKDRKGASREVELGQELVKTGELVIERVDGDNTSTGIIQSLNRRGVKPGNWLIVKEEANTNFYFEPKAAPPQSAAQIINLPDSVLHGGKYYTVVLDKGQDAGLEKGHTFIIQKQQIYVNDPHTGVKTKIPAETIGTIMVYEVFNQTSLALVMETKEHIKLGYMAIAP